MNIRIIFAILKKELRGYLYNPTTYIIAGVFIAVWEFLFFQNVFLIGQATLQGLFELLPWFFLLFIPAITMGSIAEETNKETLEILLTHPIKDRELVVGKYFSGLIFSTLILVASLPIAITFSRFGDFDFGVYVGEFIAGFLLASALVALGVGVSTYFRNQVPVLLVSVVSVFVLIMIGTDVVTMSLPAWFGALLSRFSVLPHFSSLARGVIDARDVWYFILFSIIFLELGCMKMRVRRTNKASARVLRSRTVVLVLVAVLVATVGFGFFPRAQIDLTKGNIYTLTEATKSTLSNLSDDVEIVLYASEGLPAQYQTLLRTVKDVLTDYHSYGSSHVTVTYKDPDTDQTAVQGAQEDGIRPAQFNMVGEGEFKVKQAYFGIVVKALGDKKTIPLIQKTSDLEYQLTSFISELTKKEKKKIGFLDIAGKNSSQGYSVLAGELKKQFFVEDVSITVASSTIPEGVDVLVIAGPTGMFTDLYTKAVREFLTQGKSVLFMLEGVEVNPQYGVALPNGTTSDVILEEYGVTVPQVLVYDLRSNETVSAGGGGGMRLFLPYPNFLRVGVTEGIFAGSNIESVVVPWGSTVAVDESIATGKGLESLPLLYTSQYAGVQLSDYIIDVQGAFPTSNLSQQIIGVLLKPKNDGENKIMSRIIVLGDSDLLSDEFIQQIPENFAFGIEAVSYLAQEGSLAGIKLKQEASHPLTFNNQKETLWIQYANMFGALALLIVIGVIVIGRRRNKRKLTYKEGKNRI